MLAKSSHGQAMAGKTQYVEKEAFDDHHQTEIRWLGNASIMINSHGTNIMIDPLLEGFDMPLLIDMPILPSQVPSLDAILITHIDNDHFSRMTCTDLKAVCNKYYAPNYVGDVMLEEEYPVQKCNIGDGFKVGSLDVKLTPAKHNWQNGSKKWQYRFWQEKDYCGYWLDTPDGSIWLPGDSQLLESHLHMKQPNVILFDFADNEWHITLNGAIKLANTYPDADLICIHWGCVDAPDMTPFNGNPEVLFDKIINSERIKVLAPGECYVIGEDQ